MRCNEGSMFLCGPLAFAGGAPQHIGALVPEEIGGNAHGALDRCGHHIGFGTGLFSRQIVEILHIDHRSIAPKHDAPAKLLRALPRLRDAVEPVIIAVERLKRSEEHTSELQSLMRISYAVFCLQKKNK